MAAYRRKLFAVGLSWAALMSRSVCQSSRRLAVLPTLLRNNWKTLSVTGALCAVPFIQSPGFHPKNLKLCSEDERSFYWFGTTWGNQKNLSHKDLVRRASSLVTNSANTYLSQTTLALVDSISGYNMAIDRLVSLHKHYVDSINRISSVDEDAIWQLILRRRQEVIDRRKDYKRFESCWMKAIDLSKLATEAAFNAGADQASVTAENSLQLAQSQVEEAQQMMLEAERQLKNSKAEESERLQNAFSTAMEEEDVPDAYLRED